MAGQWTDDDRRVVREFAAWLDVTGTSQEAAARLLGIAPGTLSPMLAETYVGRVGKICERMIRALTRARLIAAVPQDPPYVTTSVTKQVTDTLVLAHTERRMAMVLGPSGVGKTMAVRRYAEAEPETIYIVAGTESSPWAFMRRLAGLLRVPWHGSTYDMRLACADHLRNSDRLLVVDECDYQPERTLQTIRLIHDDARIGVALVATPAYLKHLRDAKSDTLQQVLGRIAYVAQVAPCCDDDLARIAAPFGLDDAAMDALVEGAHGQARRAVAALAAARRRSNDGITAAAVKRAYQALMPAE